MTGIQYEPGTTVEVLLVIRNKTTKQKVRIPHAFLQELAFDGSATDITLRTYGEWSVTTTHKQGEA